MFNESNITAHDTEISLLLSKYFIYHFNNKSVTYAREHAERGTHRLKTQHKKDRLLLADSIQNNYNINDFYPDFHVYRGMQLFNAWTWMGGLYCSLGAFKYADNCYKKAYTVYKYQLNIVSIRNIIYICVRRLKCIRYITLDKMIRLTYTLLGRFQEEAKT